MHLAIIQQPLGKSLTIALDDAIASTMTIGDLQQQLVEMTGIPMMEQRIMTIGGLPCQMHEQLFTPDVAVRYLSLSLRLLGGKGGFGSELRKMGARLAAKKTTNFDSCRDLSGRRLKTVRRAKE
jgi:hypothetical protein